MKYYYIRIGVKDNTDKTIYEGTKAFRSFYAASNWAQKETHHAGGEVCEIKLTFKG